MSVESTKHQEQIIDSTEVNFNNIKSKNAVLTESITKIDNMLSNLLKSNDTIVDSITHLSATSEEVTASADKVTALTSNNLENVDMVNNLVNELKDTTNLLDKYYN